MSRFRLLLVVAATAAGAVGCAHCDTCDDFPAPCNGGNCGGFQAFPTAGALPMGPVYDGSAPSMMAPPVVNSRPQIAPPATSSGSPFAPDADSPANNLPSNPADSPPAGPDFGFEPSPLP